MARGLSTPLGSTVLLWNFRILMRGCAFDRLPAGEEINRAHVRMPDDVVDPTAWSKPSARRATVTRKVSG
jgi:hypothetical protein